uniref:Ectonucleoside triphosphate diphosphohydrolase 2 n=1 Tax=Pseudonaja textilis TaxID=8673 RepID=A0A670YSS4_PSETE
MALPPPRPPCLLAAEADEGTGEGEGLPAGGAGAGGGGPGMVPPAAPSPAGAPEAAGTEQRSPGEGKRQAGGTWSHLPGRWGEGWPAYSEGANGEPTTDPSPFPQQEEGGRTQLSHLFPQVQELNQCLWQLLSLSAKVRSPGQWGWGGISNSQASDSVLEAVTSTLKKYPFDFRGARILSGEDEGLFGWVTANYLLENFVKYGWIGRWIRPKKSTVGAMDLGGASTQITFETTGAIESPSNQVTLKLYGQHYKVYTHSFLCYGMNEIHNRLTSKILKVPVMTQRGRSFPMESIYGSPCTRTERPPNYFPMAMVNMSGSGDPAQCLAHAESLFRFTDCPYSSCSFDGVFQPPVQGNFIAFSSFFYTVDFLRSVMKRQVATPKDLKEGAEAVCNTPWSELLRKEPNLEHYLQNYCSMATFVSLLLTRGYSFSNTTFPSIAFQQKAGDTTIGWALGYMLNLTNMIPAEEPSFRKSTSFGPWVGLILLFVAVLLGSLVSIFCLMKSSKGRGAV